MKHAASPCSLTHDDIHKTLINVNCEVIYHHNDKDHIAKPFWHSHKTSEITFFYSFCCFLKCSFWIIIVFSSLTGPTTSRAPKCWELTSTKYLSSVNRTGLDQYRQVILKTVWKCSYQVNQWEISQKQLWCFSLVRNSFQTVVLQWCAWAALRRVYALGD